MDEKIQAQLEEKARVLEEQKVALEAKNKATEEKLRAFEEKEMNALKETYKTLASEKSVSVKEGYEKLSKEVLEALVETLKSVKVLEPTKTAEKKDETKGQTTEKTDDMLSPFIFERAETGKGFSMTAKDIGALNPRYAR